MPQVKSTSDLQRNIGEIYELCKNTREPVYITHKGGRDLVIMDADAFDEAMSLQRDIYAREMRAYDALVASQREVEAGRTRSLEELRLLRRGIA